jgi:hypothetical protein
MQPAVDPLDALSPQVAETVRWALEQIVTDAPTAGDASLARFAAPNWRSPSRLLFGLNFPKAQIGRFAVSNARVVEGCCFEIEVVGRKDRVWLIRLHLDAEARIISFAIMRPLPRGISLRAAVAADWLALAELEHACPTTIAPDKRTSLYRGEALANHFALQREYTVWVAEHEGRLVGARAFPIREVSMAGRTRRYAYSHFARVHPDYQSIGLFQPLNAIAAQSVQPSIDGVFAYADPANETIKAALGGYPTWSVRPFRAELDCARLAGPTFGRQAEPTDAARIVELANACHGREGFFARYTVATLNERLSRASDAYSWGNLQVSAAAVVGTWLCAERRTVVDASREDEMVRGLVLDYGFLPDGDTDDLEALIRHWCACAHAKGMTHLSVFSSPPSPGAGTIMRLADRIEEFDFSFDEREPIDLDMRGVYVDAAYF